MFHILLSYEYCHTTQCIILVPLLNDFVYKGFPLMKSSPEAKLLKDKEKVDKCVEVLSSLILGYIDVKEKPGIISICEIDKMDELSKQLLRRVFETNANLMILGGVDDNSCSKDGGSLSGDAVGEIIRQTLGETSDRDVELFRLQSLDEVSYFC